MSIYPINLCLEQKKCLVVGGGKIAERKVSALLQAQGVVTVIAPTATAAIAQWAEQKEVFWQSRPYQAGEAAGYFLVICATDQGDVNRQAAADALQAERLVNVVDDPMGGNFHVPAQVVRGDLVLTVSTGGKSPAFSRQLRQELADRYGPAYGEYLQRLEEVRQRMKECLDRPEERERFWRAALDEEVLTLLAEGKSKEAEEKIYYAAGGTGTQP